MTQVFSQEALSKSTFKWQDLAGKVLSIHVQSFYDSLYKEEYLTVLGYEEITDKCYVLHQKIK